MHARRALSRVALVRPLKRHYVQPALAQELTSVGTAQDAGPSDYYLRPTTNQPASDTLTTRFSSQDDTHLTALRDMMYIPASKKEINPQHDKAWAAFTGLTDETRSKLPAYMLKRILRHVVPTKKFIQKAFIAKRNASTLSERDTTQVTDFPWEPRLQYVTSYLKALEESEKLQKGRPLEPQERIMEISDYLHILRLFSLTGHIHGAEMVIREMQAVGLPLTDTALELRLAVITTWLSTRKQIYRRFVYEEAKRTHRTVYGIGHKAVVQTQPFFPPDIAALLKDILQAIQNQSAPHYRRFSTDLLLRIAKETGNDQALEKLLKTVYRVDLKYPDADTENFALDSVEKDQRKASTKWSKGLPTNNVDQGTGLSPVPREMNVHTLNTVIARFAEQGDIWKVLQTLDVLSTPIDRIELKSKLDIPGASGLGLISDLGQGITTVIQEDARPQIQEEEAVTLTEALRREAESGETLGFFGKATPVDVTPTEVSIKFPIRPSSDFLSVLPSPFEIQSHMAETPMSSVSRNDMRYYDNDHLTNSKTYDQAIKACAIQAGIARNYVERRRATALGIHFLKVAVRDMMERHNAFLAVWLRMTSLTHDLKDFAKESKLPTELVDADGEETLVARNKTLAKTRVDEMKADQIRAKLRAQMEYPAINIDSWMVLPLYQVIRSAKSNRGERGLSSWITRSLEELDAEVEKVSQYYRQEWQIITGCPFDAENLVRAEAEPIGIIGESVLAKSDSFTSDKKEPLERLPGGTVGSSGSKLPPSFFTSPLASKLNVQWTENPEQRDIWRRLTHKSKRTRQRFDLTKHIKLVRKNLTSLDELLSQEKERRTRLRKKIRERKEEQGTEDGGL